MECKGIKCLYEGRCGYTYKHCRQGENALLKNIENALQSNNCLPITLLGILSDIVNIHKHVPV